jgi:hypothetical protein
LLVLKIGAQNPNPELFGTFNPNPDSKSFLLYHATQARGSYAAR